MTRARDIYRSIERAEAELAAEDARLTRRMAELSEEAAEISRAEAAAYRTIAQVRLDALARDRVAGRLDAAEQTALDALDARRSRLEESETARAGIAAEIDAARARREAAEDALEAALDARDARADTTAERLAETAEWQALRDRAEAAEARAEAADAKADRAEADRAAKSAAYDRDPLFAYLWARGYDTPDYRAMAIVRHVDGKVARLVGYPAARRDYVRLHEIPARLRAHADRVEAAAEAERAALADLERTALEADGIAPLEAALTEAEAALDAVDAEIAALEETRERREAEAAGLADPENDAGLLRALDTLVASFETADLRRLAETARATPAPEDDRAVQRLGELAEARDRVRRELDTARRDERALAQRRADLAEERRRFRRHGYGAPGGRFDNGDALGSLLGQIVTGTAKAALREALRTGYRAPSGRRRRGFGGLRMPRSAPAPTRSRGGFSTGGGF